MTSANNSIWMSATRFHARWAVALRDWRRLAASGIARLKAIAPYALIEIILPGGSVMALLLWLYRRHQSRAAFPGFPVELLASLQ
jgi:hypothetical protein